MNSSFKLNGTIYTIKYAWAPVRTTSGGIVWLTTYYQYYTLRNTLVIIDQFEFTIRMIRY